jgi:hypothetical protein
LSGSLLGFPAARIGAEPLEMPGPIVEYPATTRFRLVPVEQTRYVRFAKAFFAEEGRIHLIDGSGSPLVDGYKILAGRHRVSGASEADLILMIVPLKRERYGPPELGALVFRKAGGSWHPEAEVSGYGVPGKGSIRALVSPIVGVTYRGDPPDDIDPPFWVPPMRDGRRTIVWNDEGMFWNGSKWEFFCWRQCGERG